MKLFESGVILYVRLFIWTLYFIFYALSRLVLVVI